MLELSRKKFLAMSAVTAAFFGTGIGCGTDDGKKGAVTKPSVKGPKRPKKSVNTIRESPRTVPVMAETDVLVVGSGPSGLAGAQSIKNNVSCHRVNMNTVQERLKKQGVRIT